MTIAVLKGRPVPGQTSGEDAANHEDSELANAESIHWNVHMYDGNLIDFGPITEEPKYRFDIQQKVLDSLLYQRENHN